MPSLALDLPHAPHGDSGMRRLRQELHVIGVAAALILAAMIDALTRGDWPVPQLECVAVN